MPAPRKPSNPTQIDRILMIESFDPELYEDIDLNRLTVYGISRLQASNIPITIDRLAVALFKLFPLKFSMAEFAMFPDTVRVQRAILQLRPKYRNWARGTIQNGYIELTQQGLAALEQTKELLDRDLDKMGKGEVRRSVTLAGKARSNAEAFMASIEASKLFAAYRSGETHEDIDWDFFDLLHASEVTDKATLRSNLDTLKSFAKSLERQDILEFLEWVRSNFSKHL